MLVDLSAAFRDAVDFFELAEEKGAADFAGDVGGADIDPRIFIDFSAKVSLAVSAFVADDFGAFDEGGVIDAQSATFAADEVFSFVKAVAAEVADGSECAAVVPRVNALGSIFDDFELVSAGDGHDAIHFAGDAGVVHDADHTSAGGDGIFDERFVDIECIRSNINEDWFCAESNESGGGGDEGVGGHYDFVARLKFAELCCHFECGSAGGGEEYFGDVEAFLEERGAFFGEVPISTEVTEGDGLSDVVEFFTGDEWGVEGDIHSGDHRGPAGTPKRRDFGQPGETMTDAANGQV